MPTDEEMMTLSATCAFFGGDKPIHYSTLYRGIAEGRYPKPVRIGPNTSRWLRSECRAAWQALIEERDRASDPDLIDKRLAGMGPCCESEEAAK